MRNIRYYFIADIISQLGSNIALISLNWFLIEKTNSNSQLGLMALIGVTAGLLTCPIGGIIADRFSRKSILMYSNIVRGILITLIAIILTQDFRIYYLYALSIISGVGFNIHLPASKALVQEMTDPKAVIKWNAVIEINVQISMFAAGALAGLLYNTLGIYTILWINAATFFVATCLLYFIKYTKIKSHGPQENIFSSFRSGFSYLISKPTIFFFILIMLIPHVASITSGIVMPGYVRHHLGSDSFTYGMISMCYGIGATLVSALFIFVHRIYFHKYIMQLSFASSIISIFVMIFSKSVTASIIATLFFGLGNSSIKIILLSTIMRIINTKYMGRVISVKNLIITAMQMAFSYCIGVSMDKFGEVSGWMILEALMITSLMCYVFLARRFVRLFK